MDKQYPFPSEMDPPVLDVSHTEGRFKDGTDVDHVGIWSLEAHAETSVEKSVRQTLNRIHIIGGTIGAVCVMWLLFVGLNFYHRATYVDPVKPDYSLLRTESDTYWTDRILIDIETARQSAGTDQVRQQRLQKFVYQTVEEAMSLSPPYNKAQAVTSIAMVLTTHDINITLDHFLRQLGTTELIASMRARVLVSQSLMYLRLVHKPAARSAIQQYNRLILDSNLKLNSPLNEISFFGAVTVLRYLDDSEGLAELFNHQMSANAVMGREQRMKAYRLIAGEQARIGMTLPALETTKHIPYPVELVRALALILYNTARPPKMALTEPVMIDIPLHSAPEPLVYPRLTEQTIHKVFQYLAESKDVTTQTSLLRRLAGSRLMCDIELHKIFRSCVIASEVLDAQVKQPVLTLLDNPESPTIRAALKMPPHITSTPPSDTATDDWSTSEESIIIDTAHVDSTPLRSRNEQQWIQALLAIAQGYQSVRRFQDADRILKQTFVAAQSITDTDIRSQLLMQIGEQQIAVGSIADAKLTLAAALPILNLNQKGELARLYVIARLFADAQTAIAVIESAQLREYACSFLLQEQIRLHDLQSAAKTLALMPQGKTTDECRSQLNIAQGQASRNDFKTLGLSFPDDKNHNREQHCIGLTRRGLLFTANQSAERINDTKKRADVLTRIAQDYQLLYQSFNNANDENHIIRRSVRETIVSIAERTGQPINQTAILSEFLTFFSNQVLTDSDRAEGRQILAQAINACRRIPEPDKSAVLFAQLIIAKNFLDAPTFVRNTYPLFTRESNRPAFAETSALIDECLNLINVLTDEEQQGNACVYLARALAQVGRTSSAQSLHERVLEIVPRISNRQQSIPMLLAMIPTLKAMNTVETIPIIYQLAIDEVIREFINQSANIDVYEWRMRDSEIEWIVRSQMENGFVNDAVESATRLKEPMLHDRLLRSAAYIFLDQGKMNRAELEAQRLTVKHIQSEVMRNIQIIKNRSSRETGVLPLAF